jgi:hypothetical protein
VYLWRELLSLAKKGTLTPKKETLLPLTQHSKKLVFDLGNCSFPLWYRYCNA